MGDNDDPRDAKAEAVASSFGFSCLVTAIETVEDLRKVLRLYSLPLIPHSQAAGTVRFLFAAQVDVNCLADNACTDKVLKDFKK